MKNRLIWVLAVLMCGDILTTGFLIGRFGSGSEVNPFTKALFEEFGVMAGLTVFSMILLACLFFLQNGINVMVKAGVRKWLMDCALLVLIAERFVVVAGNLLLVRSVF